MSTLKEQARQAEKKVILETLAANNYNKSQTAKALRIDRKTLYNKMRGIQIIKPMKPSLARIVHYHLTETDIKVFDEIVSRSPIPALELEHDKHEQKIAAAFIIGCKSNEETAPVNLVVVSEHGAMFSLKDVKQGTAPGEWCEPPRV